MISIQEIAEEMIRVESDPQFAAQRLAVSLTAHFSGDMQAAAKAAVELVRKIYPIVYGTGAQYQHGAIDLDAKRAARDEISMEKFVRKVRKHIPKSRSADTEKIAAAALEKAKSLNTNRA